MAMSLQPLCMQFMQPLHYVPIYLCNLCNLYITCPFICAIYAAFTLHAQDNHVYYKHPMVQIIAFR